MRRLLHVPRKGIVYSTGSILSGGVVRVLSRSDLRWVKSFAFTAGPPPPPPPRRRLSHRSESSSGFELFPFLSRRRRRRHSARSGRTTAPY